MKLDPKMLEAIAGVYEAVGVVFGDPSSIDWEMRLLPGSEFSPGPEIRLVVWVPYRQKVSFVLTSRDVRDGVADLPLLVRRLRDMRQRVLAGPVDFDTGVPGRRGCGVCNGGVCVTPEACDRLAVGWPRESNGGSGVVG